MSFADVACTAPEHVRPARRMPLLRKDTLTCEGSGGHLGSATSRPDSPPHTSIQVPASHRQYFLGNPLRITSATALLQQCLHIISSAMPKPHGVHASCLGWLKFNPVGACSAYHVLPGLGLAPSGLGSLCCWSGCTFLRLSPPLGSTGRSAFGGRPRSLAFCLCMRMPPMSLCPL